MLVKKWNPYLVLGLPENAEAQEIRKAFRLLALRCHPDKSPPEERLAAEEVFKDLSGAYDILRDPKRRQEYDLSMSQRSKTSLGRRRDRAGSCGANVHQRSWERARTASHRSTESPTDWEPRTAPPTSWGWAPPSPNSGAMHKPIGVSPKASRVWFARGSAVVGRAYKGQEVGELATMRMDALQDLAEWANGNPMAVIDVRGCALKDEIGQRQRDALGLARCEHTFAFLTNKCGVAAEQCHAARRLGDDFQGVELRAMIRLEVNGAFEGGTSNELSCGSTLGDVASKCGARDSAKKHLMVEVSYVGGERLAQRRIAYLRRCLAGLGLPIHKISGRARPGISEEAVFLLYEELPPLDDLLQG